MSGWTYGLIEDEKGQIIIAEIHTNSGPDQSKYLPPLFVSYVSAKEYNQMGPEERLLLSRDVSRCLDDGFIISNQQIQKVLEAWTPPELDPKDFITYDEVFKEISRQRPRKRNKPNTKPQDTQSGEGSN